MILGVHMLGDSINSRPFIQGKESTTPKNKQWEMYGGDDFQFYFRMPEGYISGNFWLCFYGESCDQYVIYLSEKEMLKKFPSKIIKMIDNVIENFEDDEKSRQDYIDCMHVVNSTEAVKKVLISNSFIKIDDCWVVEVYKLSFNN